MSRLTHDLRRIAQAFLAVAFALLGLACEARAQARFTHEQFAAAIGNARSVPVDTALLRQTAADAGVAVPARPLAVFVTGGATFECGSGACAGIWVKTAAADFIIVAERAAERKPWLLRHEVLHHVLQTGAHPPVFGRLGIPTEDQ